MSAAGELLLLTIVLFILSFLVGLIPIKCNVGPFYMNLIAVLASGLILGTAIIIVLPEGFEMLLHGLHDDHDEEDDHGHEDDSHEDEEDHEDEDHEDHDEHEEELDNRLMGIAIIGGIILMMIANRLSPGHQHAHGLPGVSTTKKTENDVELVVVAKAESKVGEEGQSQTSEEQPKSILQKISAITIGLLVHAIFDGVALGIVTFGEDEELSAAVFTALMGHKVSEALSLSVILVSKGLPMWELVLNIFVFSLATPIGALLTFFVVDVGTASTENAGETVGYCLLFACGTFLGVMIEHIIPGLKTLEPGRFSWIQLLVFTVGTMLPMALPMDHGH